MRRQLACIFAASLLAVSAAVPAYADAATTGGDVKLVDATTGDGTVINGTSVSGTGYTTDYTGSPSRMAAPEIKDATTTIDGKEYTIDELKAMGYEYVLTPASKTENAPNGTVKEELKDAISDISSVPGSNELKFTNIKDENAFRDAEAAAKAKGLDLVCSNLFDLTLVKSSTKEEVPVGGLKVTVAVDNADKIVLVMHKPDTNTWETVEFKDNGDGTITMDLPNLCPIAFFVEGAVGYPGETNSSTDSNNGTDSSSSADSNTDSSSSTDSSADSSADSKADVVVPEPEDQPGTKSPTTAFVPVRETIVPGSNGVTARPTSDSDTAPASAAATNAAATGTVAATSAGGDVASPNTGVAGNGIFLLSGIVTALAGVTLVVKAKKE